MKTLDDLTFGALFAVYQSGLWLLNDMEAVLRPYGLTQAQLAILLALLDPSEGAASPHRLAQITGKSRPAISRTMEKLVRRGDVVVRLDQGDARFKHLALTDQGRELLDRVIPVYNRRLAEMSGGLTAADKDDLRRILGKLRYQDSEKRVGET